MDLYPVKAQFLSGEEVELRLDTDGHICEYAEVSIYHLNDLVYRQKVADFTGNILISVGKYDTTFAGYGASVTVCTGNTRILLETAFDVVENPKRSLRYGFLSDFTQDDADNGAVEWLNKCHINMVQYYDWSYRHDHLVTDQEFYTDMMGKPISRKTVKDKIEKCAEHGMHSIAYGAIYAASKPFFEKHTNWALYNSCQKPFVFIDVFYIMNIAKDSPWRHHLIAEYRKAITKMGFAGIHMDTYGFPKTAYSHLEEKPELIRLDQEIPSLINQTREELAGANQDPYLIFNNVGNWPVYFTAAAKQDAVYIEVWNPYERYSHIAQLIDEARQLSGDQRPIILAAYLEPFRKDSRERAMNAARILTAAIVSNGAYHLLQGENQAVLTQGYYSDYTRLSEKDAAILRRCNDFMIRYLDLFYDEELRNVSMTHMGWDNYEYQCQSHPVSTYGEANKLWLTIREKELRKCLYFVNLCGCENDYWNREKDTPLPQENIRIVVQVDSPVKGVYAASPDREAMQAQAIQYTDFESDKGAFIEFVLPRIGYWTVVWIDLQGENI